MPTAAERSAARPLQRVAMVSLHTSPLEQPGTGDAGGLNVYVAELSRRLARRGVEVEVLTRATSSDQPPVVPLADGVVVRHVPAGPRAALTKEELVGQVPAFTEEVLRGGARCDLLHTHYWLSGQVGLAGRERWGVPLVHSAHTLAHVKNATRAHGERLEPDARVSGERALAAGADRLVANTADEADALAGLYDADPSRVDVVAPGVDLDVFAPQDPAAARTALGLEPGAVVLTFVGRVQPLKAPDVLLRAAAVLLGDEPELRDRLVVAVVGGASGSGHDLPGTLLELARSLGIDDVVRLVPPCSRADLARWYAASTILSVPSYSESFGLVALEAQACGTPVVAARVGGLPTAVAEGVGGVLVDGHDPIDHARAVAGIVRDPTRRAVLSRGAVDHAARFGWDRTADGVLAAYASALAGHRAPGTMAS